MIDCYRTPEDLANWRTSQREAAHRRIAADPRYYNGHLYVTVIARNVAEARDRVADEIKNDYWHHSYEVACGIMLGSKRSIFQVDGRRK